MYELKLSKSSTPGEHLLTLHSVGSWVVGGHLWNLVSCVLYIFLMSSIYDCHKIILNKFRNQNYYIPLQKEENQFFFLLSQI